MRVRDNFFLTLAIALAIAFPAAAQVRRSPATPADSKVDVTIKLQVAGQPYDFAGKAACQHAPVASIYNVMAEMWSVEQNDGKRSIRLTVWRPRSKSGDMFSIAVAAGGKSYLVNTVKAGAESDNKGSGKVTLATSAAGGTFTISATAEKGAAITGTIKCGAFTAAIAEGGD